MLLLCALTLGLLAVLNWRSTRSVLYPPVIFCGVWALYLVILRGVGDMFYTVSGTALLVYVAGALAFSAGGLIALMASADTEHCFVPVIVPRPRWQERRVKHVLWGLIAVLMVGLPFLAHKVVMMLAGVGGSNFLWRARRAFLDQALVTSHAPLIDNLVVLALIVSIVAFVESEGLKRLRLIALTALILACLYGLLTGTRSTGIQLVLVLTGCGFVIRRHSKFKILAAMGGLFLLLFVIVGVVVGKSGASLQAGFYDNVHALVIGFFQYLLGGIVAFGKVASHPGAIEPAWDMWTFFERMAERFGANIHVPDISAAYTAVGPGMETNVYTVYFAYYPFYGLAGVVFIMLLLGFVASLIFRIAIAGARLGVILYGLFFSGIVLTCYSENFFMALNFLVKMMLFWMVYQWAVGAGWPAAFFLQDGGGGLPHGTSRNTDADL